jgi:hypothetical protein
MPYIVDMKRAIVLNIILALFLAFAPKFTIAQEKADSAAPAETKITFSYLCTSNDSVVLTANLFIKKDGEIYGLENAAIDFSITGEKENIILGKAVTNQEGNATLTCPIKGLPANKDGVVTYAASFKGNKKFPAIEASFVAKPARIKMTFNIEDSVRHINITATQKNAKGEEVPIPNEKLMIYVPRIFSMLKIGEVDLDAEGKANFEFAGQIVGDTLGNLRILVRLEESELFGYVQGQNEINWGVPKQYYKAEVPSRELWTPIAPLWMIITLIIMLAGVWAHYVYAVYELIMIKRHSKKDKPLF